MEIILAGYNIDSVAVETASLPEKACLTPETIAAAYARISRDPRPVNELRELAMGEVEKARQSNRNIVFTMGHSSIAEHAVFNIDIINVSRLLVEEIEKSRLASYTEKSQRYVLLQDDFVVPAEITASGLEEEFRAAIARQNEFYHRAYERLRSLIFAKHREMAEDPAKRSMLEGWAKEDARYAISLATETQLGMTINARSLESMIRRLAASSLTEAREAGASLYGVAARVAPSLIRYVEPTEHDLMTRAEIREIAGRFVTGGRKENNPGGENLSLGDEVSLIHATPDADLRIAAALIHTASDLPLAQCGELARGLAEREKKELFKTAFRRLRSYDSVLREFENADLHFELTVSATCFAQLKRHRIATITCQDYNPELGATIPPAVAEAGLSDDFNGIMAYTEDVYGKIKQAAPAASAYVLTNAHRRRVSLKINARELYHIARLRGDQYAQWDIRQTAQKMTELGRKAMPLTLMLAAGKDGFDALYERIFEQA